MSNTAEGGGFKFSVPEHMNGHSEIFDSVIRLGAISVQLVREERTLVDHADGRAENVAEHANMLARIAPVVAAMFFPHLDPGLVSLFATIHDDIEAYSGDTPTHEISDEELEAKELREEQGLGQLESDFADLSFYADLIRRYEERIEPEARFVRVLDKCMPYTLHVVENGVSLIKWSKERMLFTASIKNARLLREYPEFAALITLRQELINFCADTFYE